jgi:hypothetical protein
VPVVAADESSSGPAPAWTMPEKPDKPDKPVKDKGR